MAKDIETSLQDLTHLDWSESVTSSAVGGSYLKARSGEGATATYYKLSCYDEINGIYGHECVNEIIAARLMDILCVNHVPYKLIHARVKINGHLHETWLTSSESFRRQGESKMSLARFYDFNHLKREGRLEFCERFGWLDSVRKIMLVDYLIANRDRHGGNIEILKTREGSLRLAPLFDNGLSLCFSAYSAKQMEKIDPLQDIVSNNYLGTRSLEENLLRFVPGKLALGRLQAADKKTLFHDLEPALDQAIYGMSGADFAAFLWNMIWVRWGRYESLRDSGRLQAKG